MAKYFAVNKKCITFAHASRKTTGLSIGAKVFFERLPIWLSW